MAHVLFGITAPWSCTVGWGYVVLMRILFMAEDLRWEPTLVLTAQWKPWVTKWWKYSTTLGRGIVYQPTSRAKPGEPPTRVQKHEHVHIRQTEDQMALSLCLGIYAWIATGKWWHGVLVWWSGGMWQIPNFLTAVLRGGHVYRDSEHERSAYAQTDLDTHGKCWLDEHLAAPRKW